jgi:hypothetical protein
VDLRRPRRALASHRQRRAQQREARRGLQRTRTDRSAFSFFASSALVMYSVLFEGRREILETGGQLAIAGKVVGRWGGQHTNRGGAPHAQQVRQSVKSRTPTCALQTRPTSTQIRPPPPVSSTTMRPHQVSLMHPRGSMNMGALTNRRMPMGAPPPPPPMPPVYRPVPPMVPAPPYGSFPMMTRGPVGHVPSMDALQQYQASIAGRPQVCSISCLRLFPPQGEPYLELAGVLLTGKMYPSEGGVLLPKTENIKGPQCFKMMYSSTILQVWQP